MYHRVNNYDPNCLSTRTDVFEETLSILRDEYNVISLSTLLEILTQNKQLMPDTVIITFDDGYRDNILIAAPLLKKYNLPATFFVTSQYIGTKRMFPWDDQCAVKHELMDWDEVRELSQLGFEIGGHTANHVNLAEVSLDIAEKEITGCKKEIENKIGHEITSFTYPFGHKDCMKNSVIPIIKQAGFKCSCSGYGGKVTKNSNLFNLPRLQVYPSAHELIMDIDNFAAYVDNETKLFFCGRDKA